MLNMPFNISVIIVIIVMRKLVLRICFSWTVITNTNNLLKVFGITITLLFYRMTEPQLHFTTLIHIWCFAAFAFGVKVWWKFVLICWKEELWKLRTISIDHKFSAMFCNKNSLTLDICCTLHIIKSKCKFCLCIFRWRRVDWRTKRCHFEH